MLFYASDCRSLSLSTLSTKNFYINFVQMLIKSFEPEV